MSQSHQSDRRGFLTAAVAGLVAGQAPAAAAIAAAPERNTTPAGEPPEVFQARFRRYESRRDCPGNRHLNLLDELLRVAAFVAEEYLERHPEDDCGCPSCTSFDGAGDDTDDERRFLRHCVTGTAWNCEQSASVIGGLTLDPEEGLPHQSVAGDLRALADRYAAVLADYERGDGRSA